MKKEFNNLVALLQKAPYSSEVAIAIQNLEDKIDEVEKRIECAVRSAKESINAICKYTEDVDCQRPINMHVNDHDSILRGSTDVKVALDMGDTECIENNWYNLFLKPIAVGNIEYEFPEDVYTIGNADNTDIVGDVYESDFIRLCELGLIWCESDSAFPIGEGNKANYVVRNNEFIVIVKNRQIDLSKVPIKRETFMTFESSWGEIDCDEDGNVMEIRGDEYSREGEKNYLFDISRFDLVEYGKFCESKNITMGEADDILSVGFWKKDNTYNEPDHDWRKNIFSPKPTMLCQDEDKHNAVKDIIAKLKEIDVDGETMQYILEQVGMNEQMAKQLGVINF